MQPSEPSHPEPPSRPALEVREALLIAFFATFLVAARAALRWHLHIPGHSMLPAAFALVVVRSCVDRRAAASLCGLVAGVAITGLGMGRGGPILVLKLALPGAVVDVGGLVRSDAEGRARIPLAEGALLGALAGATGFLPVVLVEQWAGVEPAVIALHAATAAGTKAMFGAVGGWAGAWVARELRHHGVIGP
jgi:hypothetical protein